MEIEILSATARSLLNPETPLEQVATGFRFTEGPLWDPRASALYFSDIPANLIFRWTQEAGAEVYREPSRKSNGLTWDLEGRLLACEHVGRQVSRTEGDGTVATVVDRFQGKRLNSPNDLVLRSDGLLYFSDPPYGLTPEFGAVAEQEQPLNGLYLLRPGEKEPVLLADDFDRPNGLAFSPDERRLYVADTPRYHLRLFDVREDGTLEGGEVLAAFPEHAGPGRPDGMKVDVQGNIWTTGPGGLWIVNPAGEALAHLKLPEKSANCAWGDADYRSLYIMASTSVYRVRTLVRGVAPVGLRCAVG
jgi:gluconolactonase